MAKLGIKDIPLKDKKVFIRVDFNVPLDETGQITDDTRIMESLPTIKYALEQGAKVILASHLGRPKGKPDPKLSLRHVYEWLRVLLGVEVLLQQVVFKGEDLPIVSSARERLAKKVIMARDCIGPEVKALVDSLQPGEVILLENLRFHKEEEANDDGFARELASLADLYINDAFGSAHRAHASTHGITKYLDIAAAGLLMQKELEYLGKALEVPEKPFVAILGGAKVSDKIGILENLLDKVDSFIIGGGMAYTFLKAQGKEVGCSLVETDKLGLAKEIIARAQTQQIGFLLPTDSVAARECKPDSEAKVMPSDHFEPSWMGLDIGPGTISSFSQEIAKARTILWNGPMGVFEIPQFSQGTIAVAKEVASSRATSIIGGGDTAAAVKKAGVKMTHISTGGGASLEFLEGKTLPGVAVLRDK